MMLFLHRNSVIFSESVRGRSYENQYKKNLIQNECCLIQLFLYHLMYFSWNNIYYFDRNKMKIRSTGNNILRISAFKNRLNN